MKYQEEIKRIIQNTVSLTEEVDSIDFETSLVNAGMDSLSFVRIVVEIENHFDLEFPDDKLVFTEADTIKTLCKIVLEVKGEV